MRSLDAGSFMKSRETHHVQEVLRRDMRRNMVVFSPGCLDLMEESSLGTVLPKFEDKDTVACSGSLHMPGKPSIRILWGCLEG